MTIAGMLTVPQVCQQLPGKRGAERLAPSTVVRWIIQGCPARSGTRVKLTATRVGARWCIRPDDLKAFFDALAAAPEPTPVPHVPTPREEKKQLERTRRASEKLKAAGA